MKTISEVAKLCGTSVRTLHYYDQIGLLAPSETTGAGYRMYDDTALARLQQILFFRELDFPLKEIRAILESPSFDPRQAMERHRSLLTMKRERLNSLISLIDQNLKGESNMSLQEFSMHEIEAARREYGEEARKRWGGSEAYAESERRTSGYSKEDWARVNAEMEVLYRTLAEQMNDSPDAPEAQQLIADWQEYITRNFYPCTHEILAGLGEMYVADERFTKNIDQYGKGLAQFISEAIRVYCAGCPT